VTVLQRSIAITEEAKGRDDPRLATPFTRLAAVHAAAGRLDEAAPLYERALALAERASGPAHCRLVPLLNRLAEGQIARGERPASEALHRWAWAQLAPGERRASEDLYRRAVAVADTAADCDPSERMMALNNLAFLYRERGETDEAKHL